MREDVSLVILLVLTSLIGSLYSQLQEQIVSNLSVPQTFPNKLLHVKTTNDSVPASKSVSSEQIEANAPHFVDLLPPVQPIFFPDSTSVPSTSTSITTTTPTETTPNPSTADSTTTLAPTSSSSPTTTSLPVSSTTQKPSDKPCKKFDGPSFVGGVVLTMGLMAIAFVAYKFYKARNERNYHTL